MTRFAMAALQPVENQQRSYEVFEKKQTPPDVVVKSQAVDIIGLTLPLIRGQNVVETSRRHRKSRVELLSPSQGHWFIPKPSMQVCLHPLPHANGP